MFATTSAFHTTPRRYVVEKPSALCSEVGIAGFRLLPRTRARNWETASVSIARRLKIQGPSSKGCSASISPRSTASRSVLALSPNVLAASVRLKQVIRPALCNQKNYRDGESKNWKPLEWQGFYSLRRGIATQLTAITHDPMAAQGAVTAFQRQHNSRALH
jgi:hypothetical protein